LEVTVRTVYRDIAPVAWSRSNRRRPRPRADERAEVRRVGPGWDNTSMAVELSVDELVPPDPKASSELATLLSNVQSLADTVTINGG
jgi:hypothetical protein